ncbi:MAG: bifunctional riboflavin kinase/FAD synthetase [Shimia sp.]
MRRITHLAQVGAADRGASLAIGNFDGVHLGHRAVIDLARRDGAALGVLTFEPHPRTWFARARGLDPQPFRLMSPEARASRLAQIGVDILFELPFDAALAEMPPEAFVQSILADGLGAGHVVTGGDFKFGKDRAGDTDTLHRLAGACGIEVTTAPLVAAEGRTVSSTAIRTALGDGRPGDAAMMLGHFHRIEGPVIHGEKRGRELGFPTANMSIEGLHPPAFGVYSVIVDVLTGPHRGRHKGAASIGVRPMFGENVANCETYLLDFQGDLYGETLSVALVDFLRPEERFDGVEALIVQMNADVARARHLLQGLT